MSYTICIYAVLGEEVNFPLLCHPMMGASRCGLTGSVVVPHGATHTSPTSRDVLCACVCVHTQALVVDLCTSFVGLYPSLQTKAGYRCCFLPHAPLSWHRAPVTETKKSKSETRSCCTRWVKQRPQSLERDPEVAQRRAAPGHGAKKPVGSESQAARSP